MKAIRSFKSLLYKAHNGEHFQFQTWIITDLGEKISAVSDLQAEYTAYKALFDIEDEIYKRMREQEGSAEVQRLDYERDQLFYSIRASVDAVVRNMYSDVQADGIALQKLLHVYKGAERKNYVDNTAEVTNFVQDTRKEPYVAHVEALGIKATIDKLEEVNLEFDEIYRTRFHWVGDQDRQGKMTDIRPQVDEAFGVLVTKIQVLYQANELSAKDPAVQASLGELIDRTNDALNQLARLSNSRIHSGSTGDGSGNGDGDGGEKPTDPHNPDNLPEIRISEVKMKSNEEMLVRAEDIVAFDQFVKDHGVDKADAPGIVFVEYVKPTEKKLHFYQLDSFEIELNAESELFFGGLNLSPSTGKLFVVPFTEDTLANPYDCFLCLDAYTHLALLNVKKPKETLIPPEK